MKTYRIRPLSIAWWLTVTPWMALIIYFTAQFYELWMRIGGELLCR